MPHLARSCMARHADDVDRTVAGYDEANAHNKVDRHACLLGVAEVAPGICRSLELIYQTGQSTIIFLARSTD